MKKDKGNKPVSRGRCPKCGMNVTNRQNFCENCRKFVSPDFSELCEPGQVPDETLDAFLTESLEAYREQQKGKAAKKHRRGKIMIWIGGFLILTLLLAPIGAILVFKGLADMMAANDMDQSCLTDEEIEDVIASYLVPVILEDAFDQVLEYRHDKAFPSRMILESSLMQKAYNEVEGSDYIKAVHKGLEVEMGDVELKYASQKYAGLTESKSVFKGTFLTCLLDLRLPESVVIWEREGHEDMGVGLATGNEAFDRQFYVESRHPETAAQVMTPQLIQQILHLDTVGDGQTTLKFMENGRLYLAIASEYDLFELKKDGEDIASIKERYRKELQRILDLMTVLSEIKTSTN